MNRIVSTPPDGTLRLPPERKARSADRAVSVGGARALIRRSFIALGLALASLATAPVAALELPPSREEMPPLMVGIVEGALQIPAYARPFCPRAEACVLGTGGGIGARLEWRMPSGISTGVGLDYSVFDGGGLSEISTLGTLRYTVRALLMPLSRVHPLLEAGLGVAIFGDAFMVDTFGGVLDLRGGVELEVSPSMAIDLALGVRLLGVSPYVTQADEVRRGAPFGPTAIIGLHVGLVLLPEPFRPRPPRSHPEGSRLLSRE